MADVHLIAELYFVSEWIIRIAMLVVITWRRRSATSATAWLLVVLLIPWVGLIAYLLIGENRLWSRRGERQARLLEKWQDLIQRMEQPDHADGNDLVEVRPVMELTHKLGRFPLVGGNHLVLMDEHAESIARLIETIDGARDHVHLLFYIFEHDETGLAVLDACERAVKRGVSCRLMVDSVGSAVLLRHARQRISDRGIELCEALPVRFLRRRAARIDLRNHRKIAVIDGRIGFTGSLNMVDPLEGGLPVHDVFAEVQGPIVWQLQAVFLADWYFENDEMLDDERFFPKNEPRGDLAMQLQPSGPNTPQTFARVVVSAIYRAQRRIVITTPYFVPDDPLLQALIAAASRGVQVRLILPRKTDHPIVDYASRAYYEELLEAGVEIHLYQAGVLHSKTLTTDDGLAYVGSSNLDPRSFELNLEVNLLCYGRPAHRRVMEIQDHYLTECRQLTLEEWRDRSRLTRLGQNLAQLMSPLL